MERGSDPGFIDPGFINRRPRALAAYRIPVYATTVSIQAFRCKDTEALHNRRRVKRFQACEAAARRKLAMLDAATALRDLASPPGKRLQALEGGRKGQHSIRINDQFRVCFVWTDKGPFQVEIVDYH